MSDPRPAADHAAEPTVDSDVDLSGMRTAKLVRVLVEGDAARRAAVAAELTTRGQAAVEELRFASTDTRAPLAGRARAGTLLGRIGDPRLEDPERIGPFCEVFRGPFVMGAGPQTPEASTNACPEHEVELRPYAMARYPVTNAAFALFVEDGGYVERGLWSDEGWAWRASLGIEHPHYWRQAERWPTHPIVGVSWFEAGAYCRWLHATLEARGALKPAEVVRLPTEAEWEKAARGGRTLDQRRSQPNPMPRRRFPWGEAFVRAFANTAESNLGRTCPVGMFPEGDSPYRVAGLSGNILEWCHSRPAAYPYRERDGREHPAGGARTYRVARGGGWPFSAEAASCAHRHWNHADFRGGMIGLRVVRGRALD